MPPLRMFLQPGQVENGTSSRVVWTRIVHVKSSTVATRLSEEHVQGGNVCKAVGSLKYRVTRFLHFFLSVTSILSISHAHTRSSFRRYKGKPGVCPHVELPYEVFSQSIPVLARPTFAGFPTQPQSLASARRSHRGRTRPRCHPVCIVSYEGHLDSQIGVQ